MFQNRQTISIVCAIVYCLIVLDSGRAQTASSIFVNTTNNSTTTAPTTTAISKLPAQLIWTKRSYAPRSTRAKIFGSLNAATITDNGELEPKTSFLFFGKHLSRFWGLGYDFQKEVIYYTDYVKNYFGIYNVRDKSHRKIFQGLSYGLDGLAVDWLSGNVYWTDTDLNRIFVADSNFTYFTDLLTIDSRVPAKIAVNPLRNILIWTEKSDISCRIYQSNLMGKNKTLLYNLTNTLSIDDICLDPNENRLYFSERVKSSAHGVSRILYIDLDNVTTIKTMFTSSFSVMSGIASFQDYLYVCNNRQRLIFSIHKQNRTSKFLRTYRSDQPQALTVFSELTQPTSVNQSEAHPCFQNNCEQICISDGWNTYQCACAMGYHLKPDGHSCGTIIQKGTFALLADTPHSKIYQLSLSGSDQLSALPLKNIGKVNSVDFDYMKRRVFWSNTDNQVIASSFLNGSGYQVHLTNIRARSIAIEPASRNLYAINSFSNAIIVTPMDLPNVSTTLQVLKIHNAWSLLVSSRRGKVFWSDFGQISTNGSSIGYVEMMNLNGSNREVIANNTFAPTGLAIDESTSTLHWAELWSSSIVWLNLETRTRGKFQINLNSKKAFAELSGIAFHQGYLYLADTRLSSLKKLDTSLIFNQSAFNFTTLVDFGPSLFYSLSQIRIINTTSPPVQANGCASNRGNCPELCLPTSSGVPECVCQTHSTYIKKNRTCVQIYSSNDTIPPSFGNTCSQQYHLLDTNECSNTAFFNFSAPVATDNSNYVLLKRTNVKAPPYNLTRGVYSFIYKAQDRNHNLAICTVYAFVFNSMKCALPPRRPINGTLETATCGSMFGSVVNVYCNGNKTAPAFRYRCSSARWSVLGGGPPVCPPPSTSTTPSPTNTTLYETTMANLGTSKAPALGRRTAAESLAVTITETTMVDFGTYKASVVGRRAATGLSSGVIAAIVIVVLLVLIVFVVFVVMRRSNRQWSSIRFFRLRGDDQVELTKGFGDSPTHSFPVM